MKVIDINTEQYSGFRCSKTGNLVAFYPEAGSPEYEIACDLVNMTCVRGIVLDEVPEIITVRENDALGGAWELFWELLEQTDDYGVDLSDALERFDFEDLVALRVETHGMACGPVSICAFYLVSQEDAMSMQLMLSNH